MKAFIIGKSKKNNKNHEKKGLKKGKSLEYNLGNNTKNSLKLQHYNSTIFTSSKNGQGTSSPLSSSSNSSIPLSSLNSMATTTGNIRRNNLNGSEAQSSYTASGLRMNSSPSQVRSVPRVGNSQTNSTTTTTTNSSSTGSSSNGKNSALPIFKVGIRLRPLLPEEQEEEKGYEELVHIFPQNNILCIKDPGMYNEFPEIDDGPPPPPGTIAPSMGPYINTNSFHYIFGGNNNSQENVYYESIQPLVDHFHHGKNSLVLAYGQLGSGKTYSIGLNSSDYSIEEGHFSNQITSSMGFIPRAVQDTLNYINQASTTPSTPTTIKTTTTTNSKTTKPPTTPPTAIESNRRRMYMTFVAISCEDIADLLGESISRYKRPPSPGPRMSSPNDKRSSPSQPKSILVHDSGKQGIMLKGARYEEITDLETLAKLLYRGTTFRRIVFGPESENLSHAILTLHLEQTGDRGEKIYSKIHFVDLSCTEKTPPGEARKNRMECGVNDKSWLALSKVINLLTGSRPRGYIPYRDSKLTQVLQDSLSGDSQVLFLSCLSPTACDETKSTLKYMIRTTNIDMRDTVVTPKMLKMEPLRVESINQPVNEDEVGPGPEPRDDDEEEEETPRSESLPKPSPQSPSQQQQQQQQRSKLCKNPLFSHTSKNTNKENYDPKFTSQRKTQENYAINDTNNNGNGDNNNKNGRYTYRSDNSKNGSTNNNNNNSNNNNNNNYTSPMKQDSYANNYPPSPLKSENQGYTMNLLRNTHTYSSLAANNNLTFTQGSPSTYSSIPRNIGHSNLINSNSRLRNAESCGNIGKGGNLIRNKSDSNLSQMTLKTNEKSLQRSGGNGKENLTTPITPMMDSSNDDSMSVNINQENNNNSHNNTNQMINDKEGLLGHANKMNLNSNYLPIIPMVPMGPLMSSLSNQSNTTTTISNNSASNTSSMNHYPNGLNGHDEIPSNLNSSIYNNHIHHTNNNNNNNTAHGQDNSVVNSSSSNKTKKNGDLNGSSNNTLEETSSLPSPMVSTNNNKKNGEGKKRHSLHQRVLSLQKAFGFDMNKQGKTSKDDLDDINTGKEGISNEEFSKYMETVNNNINHYVSFMLNEIHTTLGDKVNNNKKNSF